jgi:hypothetical protein
MKSPECQSSHVNKNGIKRGKQNHRCVDCGRQFVANPKLHRGYSCDAKISHTQEDAETPITRPSRRPLSNCHCFREVDLMITRLSTKLPIASTPKTKETGESIAINKLNSTVIRSWGLSVGMTRIAITVKKSPDVQKIGDRKPLHSSNKAATPDGRITSPK